MNTEVQNDAAKVFVGGLSPNTTTESLTSFMIQFGPVKEAVIKTVTDMETGLKRSRGFGFVTFEHENTVHDVVAQAPLVIDDKKVDCKRIDAERESKGDIEQKKIFVGGLPDTCDHDKLKAYFCTIDPNVEEVKVMMNPQTGRSRCFGFVQFSSKEFVQVAISRRDTHFIDGKWVDVHASSKGKGKEQKGGFQKGMPKGKGKGKGGKGFGNPYGNPYADPNAGYYGAPAQGYGAQPAYAAAPVAPQYAAGYGYAPQAAGQQYAAPVQYAAPMQYADPNMYQQGYAPQGVAPY